MIIPAAAIMAALATLLLTIMLAVALLWYGLRGLMILLRDALERSNRRYLDKHDPPNRVSDEDDF